MSTAVEMYQVRYTILHYTLLYTILHYTLLHQSVTNKHEEAGFFTAELIMASKQSIVVEHHANLNDVSTKQEVQVMAAAQQVLTSFICLFTSFICP
jgi:hypothetical protein